MLLLPVRASPCQLALSSLASTAAADKLPTHSMMHLESHAYHIGLQLSNGHRGKVLLAGVEGLLARHEITTWLNCWATRVFRYAEPLEQPDNVKK